jgi:hypothetical protein
MTYNVMRYFVSAGSLSAPDAGIEAAADKPRVNKRPENMRVAILKSRSIAELLE